MPRTATLRPLTAAELSQIHIALTARIDVLEQAWGDDPDAVTPDVMSMLRELNRDVVEARRPLT